MFVYAIRLELNIAFSNLLAFNFRICLAGLINYYCSCLENIYNPVVFMVNGDALVNLALLSPPTRKCFCFWSHLNVQLMRASMSLAVPYCSQAVIDTI